MGSPTHTAPPELDAAYALSGDAREDFERDGHVLLRRVLEPFEVSGLQAADP